MAKVYELDGQISDHASFGRALYKMIQEWPHYVNVPFPIAKAISSPREILLNKVPSPLPAPTLFNLDMINALTADTVMSKDALTFNNLELVPRKLKAILLSFLSNIVKVGHNMVLQSVKENLLSIIPEVYPILNSELFPNLSGSSKTGFEGALLSQARQN